jgi:hypothetical protein
MSRTRSLKFGYQKTLSESQISRGIISLIFGSLRYEPSARCGSAFCGYVASLLPHELLRPAVSRENPPRRISNSGQHAQLKVHDESTSITTFHLNHRISPPKCPASKTSSVLRRNSSQWLLKQTNPPPRALYAIL